jgi:hypothetical protein
MLDLTDYPGLRALKDWERDDRRPARGRKGADRR